MLLLLLFGGVGLALWLGSGQEQGALEQTLFRLRLWRVLNACLAGAALAVGGVLVQGLFRNPLASPSILGTTAGASLGGMLVMVAWEGLLAAVLPGFLPPELLLPLGCLLGAWGALMLLLLVSGRNPGMVATLLTGFILSSLFLSVGGLMMSIAQDNWELGRAVVAFTLGGIDTKGARHVALAFPLVAAGLVAGMGWSRHLDVLLAGEDEAASLGVNVPRVRRWVIVWTATLTAAAVAIGGGLSFVGLVVPHGLRPFLGAGHRRLLPAAAVGGAAFVLWADLIVRLAPTTGALPLGVVTGLVGAPVFLFLLARAARQGRLG